MPCPVACYSPHSPIFLCVCLLFRSIFRFTCFFGQLASALHKFLAKLRLNEFCVCISLWSRRMKKCCCLYVFTSASKMYTYRCTHISSLCKRIMHVRSEAIRIKNHHQKYTHNLTNNTLAIFYIDYLSLSLAHLLIQSVSGSVCAEASE